MIDSVPLHSLSKKLMRQICNFIGLLSLIACGHVQAQNINIDFGNQSPTPSAAFGAAAGQSGLWNQISQTGQTKTILDINGLSTTASINLVADNIAGNFALPPSDISLLVADNFFSAEGSSWSVRLSGITSRTYDVYFYANTNPLVPTGSFDVNGLTVASFGIASGSTLILGTDYQVLRGVNVTDGVLNVESVAIYGAGGLSGMQLVTSPVPESASVTLLTVGLLFLAAFARKSRRPLPR